MIPKGGKQQLHRIKEPKYNSKEREGGGRYPSYFLNGNVLYLQILPVIISLIDPRSNSNKDPNDRRENNRSD
jgi:hypothetical protein